ncbi:MAG: ribosomal protein S18-alanine N-acetyltransferase [Bacilli bacterium]|nr:ribosomal protein S18-alanine N-acetyltransferase [Bacilli bacterium]
MIRVATSFDIEKIIELGEKYHPNFQRLFDVKDILINNNYKVYVADQNDMVIGFLIVLNTFEISNLILIFVDEEYRHRHIGTSLLDYYISELSLDVEKIILEVNVTNKNAIKFYQKFGFDIIHTRKNYYSDNNDAYIMERKIKDE